MVEKKREHENDNIENEFAEVDDTEAMSVDEVALGSEPPKIVDYGEYQKLQAERDELLDKLKRAVADYQNYKKRVAEEKKQLIDQTELNTIELFVFPLIDDIDRALQAAIDHGYDPNDPLYQGIELVRDHAFKLLKQHNIEPIDALGKEFDPLFHEAITEQPTDNVPEKTVIQVVNRGYTLNGKTIRPAKVIVAKPIENKDIDRGSEES